MEQRGHQPARSRVLVSNAEHSSDIQYALRDAGFEVIPTPDTDPAAVYAAAVQEDVPAAVVSLPDEEGLPYVIACYRAFEEADTDLVFAASPALHELYTTANEHIAASEGGGREVAAYLGKRYDWSQYDGIGIRSDTALIDRGLVPGHATYDEVFEALDAKTGNRGAATQITTAAKRAGVLWEPCEQTP